MTTPISAVIFVDAILRENVKFVFFLCFVCVFAFSLHTGGENRPKTYSWCWWYTFFRVLPTSILPRIFQGFLVIFPLRPRSKKCHYLRSFWAAAWRPRKKCAFITYIYIYIKNGSSKPKICVSSSRQTARKPFFFSSPCQIYVSERGQM